MDGRDVLLPKSMLNIYHLLFFICSLSFIPLLAKKCQNNDEVLLLIETALVGVIHSNMTVELTGMGRRMDTTRWDCRLPESPVAHNSIVSCRVLLNARFDRQTVVFTSDG